MDEIIRDAEEKIEKIMKEVRKVKQQIEERRERLRIRIPREWAVRKSRKPPGKCKRRRERKERAEKKRLNQKSKSAEIWEYDEKVKSLKFCQARGCYWKHSYEVHHHPTKKQMKIEGVYLFCPNHHSLITRGIATIEEVLEGRYS